MASGDGSVLRGSGGGWLVAGAVGTLAWRRSRGASLRPARIAADALGVVAPSAGPRLQRLFWRGAYNLWGPRGYGFYEPDGTEAFLNYGYAPLDAPADATGFGAGLYDRVAGAVDLAGRDVLEVGCGRGAGAARTFARSGCGSLVGVDLAGASVARAAAEHGRPGLRFQQGDAEALPFADASFDAVLNVESSHCYPSVPRFLAEVHRVLRPGGVLLLADLRFRRAGQEGGFVQIGHVAELRDSIARSPLEVVEEEDVTANVLRALELDSPRRAALIERRVPRLLRPALRLFSGVEGGALHADYAAGNVVYLRFVLRRAA